MAGTLRYLARSVKFTTVQKITESFATPTALSAARFQIQQRNINAHISPDVNDLDVSELPQYETSNKEWNYVERLLPLKIVPRPNKFEGPAPSGWVPPREEGRTYSYYVPRNKNHMMPVYLKISYRGSRHLTVIKYIDGDIWEFEKDARAFLKSQLAPLQYARIGSRVNEMSRQVHFRGDHVSLIKKWMEIKGF